MDKNEFTRFVSDFLIENEKSQKEILALIQENDILIQERFGHFAYNQSKVLKIVHSKYISGNINEDGTIFLR